MRTKFFSSQKILGTDNVEKLENHQKPRKHFHAVAKHFISDLAHNVNKNIEKFIANVSYKFKTTLSRGPVFMDTVVNVVKEYNFSLAKFKFSHKYSDTYAVQNNTV